MQQQVQEEGAKGEGQVVGLQLLHQGTGLLKIFDPAKERRSGTAQGAEDHHNKDCKDEDGEPLGYPNAGEHHNVLDPQDRKSVV